MSHARVFASGLLSVALIGVAVGSARAGVNEDDIRQTRPVPSAFGDSLRSAHDRWLVDSTTIAGLPRDVGSQSLRHGSEFFYDWLDWSDDHMLDPEFVLTPMPELLGLRQRAPWVSFDRVDGLFLQAGMALPESLLIRHRYRGHVGIGYAFASGRPQASIGLTRDYLDSTAPLRVGGECHIVKDTRDAWKMGASENSFATFFLGVDARDYFRRTGYSLLISKYLSRRVLASAEYRYDRYSSVGRTVERDGAASSPRENPGITDGPMRSVALRFLCDYISGRQWSDPQYSLAFELEAGTGEADTLPTPQRSYEFTSFVGDARLRVAFIRDWLLLGLRLRVGAASDGAPPQRLFSMGGYGSLSGLEQNELRGNRLLLLQSELHVVLATPGWVDLRVILSNEIGLADSPHGGSVTSVLVSPVDRIYYSPAVFLGTYGTRMFRARLGLAWATASTSSPSVILRFAETF